MKRRRSKISRQAYEDSITRRHGNISNVARELGITRQAVYSALKRWPDLRVVLEDVRETLLDELEDRLMQRARSGDLRAITFFLRTQGKERGWTERSELTGAELGPLTYFIERTVIHAQE